MEERDKQRPVFVAMDAAWRLRASVLFEMNLLKITPAEVSMQPVTRDDLRVLFGALARAAVLYRAYDGPEPSGDRRRTWDKYRGYCAAISDWAWSEFGLQCSLNGIAIAGEVRAISDGWAYMARLFRDWPEYDFTVGDEPAIVSKVAAVCVIRTNKTPEDLRRIFSELVKDGYIADGACGALEDFMMVFDDMATEQGRIVWIKQGRNRQLNKAALCAFLNLFGIIDTDKIQAFSRAIFGVDLNSSNVSRDTAEHDRLKAIIDG